MPSIATHRLQAQQALANNFLICRSRSMLHLPKHCRRHHAKGVVCKTMFTHPPVRATPRAGLPGSGGVVAHQSHACRGSFLVRGEIAQNERHDGGTISRTGLVYQSSQRLRLASQQKFLGFWCHNGAQGFGCRRPFRRQTQPERTIPPAFRCMSGPDHQFLRSPQLSST